MFWFVSSIVNCDDYSQIETIKVVGAVDVLVDGLTFKETLARDLN